MKKIASLLVFACLVIASLLGTHTTIKPAHAAPNVTVFTWTVNTPTQAGQTVVMTITPNAGIALDSTTINVEVPYSTTAGLQITSPDTAKSYNWIVADRAGHPIYISGSVIPHPYVEDIGTAAITINGGAPTVLPLHTSTGIHFQGTVL